MNDLLRIIQFVKESSPSANTALARLSLLVGEDVTKVNEQTPFTSDKIKKYKEAAEKVTKKKMEGI